MGRPRLEPELIDRAIEMRRRGASIREIREATGMSKGAIHRYTHADYEPGKKISSPFTYPDQVRWTKAVNRIRKAYGKKPFPMPYPPIEL